MILPITKTPLICHGKTISFRKMPPVAPPTSPMPFCHALRFDAIAVQEPWRMGIKRSCLACQAGPDRPDDGIYTRLYQP